MVIKVPEIQIELTSYLEWEPIQGNLKDLYTKNFEKLKKSLVDKGGFVPVFIWKHEGKLNLLDGHQRHRFFLKEEVELEHPGGSRNKLYPSVIIEAENLKDAKERLLVISSQYGTITQEGLDEFSIDLDLSWIEEAVNFDAVFTDDEAEELEPEEEGEFDGEPPEKPVTVLGDLYELVSVDKGMVHRVQCGDSCDADVVERTMGGAKAQMVFTDPPYGVDYEGIKNDNRDELGDLLRGAFANILVVTDAGGAVYVFHSDKCADIFNLVFREFFHFSSMVIWVKNSLTLSQTDYQSQHEPCLYGWVEGRAHNWYSDRKQTSLWQFNKERTSGHTTPKPTQLVCQAIKNSSKDKDSVYDPFLGSGTTLIACEQLERTCYGQELDPKYMDVIVRRWVNYMEDSGREYEVRRNGEKLAADDLGVFRPENGE